MNTIKTIKIVLPELANTEDKLIEIMNGLEEIQAALEDIVYDVDEDSEAAELLDTVVDEV